MTNFEKMQLPMGTLVLTKSEKYLTYVSHDLATVTFIECVLSWGDLRQLLSKRGRDVFASVVSKHRDQNFRYHWALRMTLKGRMFFENDKDQDIRRLVIRRYNANKLVEYIADKAPGIRYICAQKVSMQHLVKLIKDPAIRVRIAVAKRLQGPALFDMLNDASDRVRAVAAKRYYKQQVHAAQLAELIQLTKERVDLYA